MGFDVREEWALNEMSEGKAQLIKYSIYDLQALDLGHMEDAGYIIHFKSGEMDYDVAEHLLNEIKDEQKHLREQIATSHMGADDLFGFLKDI